MKIVTSFLLAGVAIAAHALSHQRLRKDLEVREALADLLDTFEQSKFSVLQQVGDQLDDPFPIHAFEIPSRNKERKPLYKKDPKKLRNKRQKRERMYEPGLPANPQPTPHPHPHPPPPLKPSPTPTPRPNPKPHPKPKPKPDDEHPVHQVVIATVAATLVVAALLYWLALIAYEAYRGRGRTYMQIRSEDLSPPMQRNKPKLEQIKQGISSAMEKGKEKVEEGANKVAHTIKPPGGKPVTHSSPTINPKK